MFMILTFDRDGDISTAYNDKLYKEYNDAVKDIENDLQENLNADFDSDEHINSYEKITTGGTQYHYKDETPNAVDGLTLFYIVNYDYNSECFISIVSVQDDNGALVNG